MWFFMDSDNQQGFNPKQGLKECKRFIQNWEWIESFQSISIRTPRLCKGIWEVDLCSVRKATQLKFLVLQGKFFHPALGGKGGEPGVIQDTPPIYIPLINYATRSPLSLSIYQSGNGIFLQHLVQALIDRVLGPLLIILVLHSTNVKRFNVVCKLTFFPKYFFKNLLF